MYYLNVTIEYSEQHLVWWEISNQYPLKIQMSENLAKLVCRCSSLKSDDLTLRGTGLSNRACVNCDMFQEENEEHLVLQCPNNHDIRVRMMSDIEMVGLRYNVELVNAGELLLNLLGKPILHVDMSIMMEFWMIAGKAISRMYTRSEVSTHRTGVG